MQGKKSFKPLTNASEFESFKKRFQELEKRIESIKKLDYSTKQYPITVTLTKENVKAMAIAEEIIRFYDPKVTSDLSTLIVVQGIQTMINRYTKLAQMMHAQMQAASMMESAKKAG